MKKAAIIIPTYNEKGNIERLITLLEKEVFPKISNYEMEIVIADDNSPDGTGEVVKALIKKWKNLYISTGKKQGLGSAYLRAMTYAVENLKPDIMFEFDADLSHDPNKIPDFLKKMDQGYDMVIGTRYSQGGSIPANWPIQRKAESVLGNLLVRIILMRFSIHDWTGGYRAIKKEVFLKEKSQFTEYKGYTFQVAFLFNVLQDGFRVAEVPFSFIDRTLGRSKIASGEYIINLLTYVITTRIKELIFGKFGKFLAVGGLGFVINAAALKILVDAFHWDPSWANLTGAALAIFSNFNFNNIWTFAEHKTRTVSSYVYKMIQFYATSAFGVIVIQTGTIILGDHFFGKKLYFIYFLIGTGLLLIWNFAMYSLVIWKKPQK